MKNILPIKIHILFYVVAFICFFTGYFKYFMVVTLFILIHEMGHISGGIFYRWNIEKIILLPFGGLTIFHEKLNRPIREEFVILILGPLYQILFYLFLSCFFQLPFYFQYVHYFLLIFNLLPIYPLDGSKILLLFLNKICSYRTSYQMTMIISYFILFLLMIGLFLYHSFVFFLTLCYFLYHVILFHKMIPYLMEKFLWERYEYIFPFHRRKVITDINQMKRDYYHLFKIENSLVTERQMLRKMFDLNVFL